VTFGRCGEAEYGVDVEHSAPLALEGSDKEVGANPVAPDRLVRPPMKISPPLRRGLVPLAGRDGINTAAKGATVPMFA
jgi:hypothetical protein